MRALTAFAAFQFVTHLLSNWHERERNSAALCHLGKGRGQPLPIIRDEICVESIID